MSDDEKVLEEEVRGLGSKIMSMGSSLKNALANSINQFSSTDNWNIFTEVKNYEQARVIANKLAVAEYFDLDVIRDREKSKLILMKNKGRAMEDAFVRIHQGKGLDREDDVDKNIGVKNELKKFLGIEDIE